MAERKRKKKKINPNCPVPGCRASKPHADDPIVKALILQFGDPVNMTVWTRVALGELTESVCRDRDENKIFAWYSRLRLPEELYIRTLYALFVVTEKELHHLLSGALPNGLADLYAKVNQVVFDGNGRMLLTQPDLKHGGTFRPIEFLHSGAHGSFHAFLTCIGLSRNPENLPSPERHREHLQKYCAYLDYMHGMFKAGKSKKDVLAGVKNLHRPASALAKAVPIPGRQEGL
jgi:hypothetical protein